MQVAKRGRRRIARFIGCYSVKFYVCKLGFCFPLAWGILIAYLFALDKVASTNALVNGARLSINMFSMIDKQRILQILYETR